MSTMQQIVALPTLFRLMCVCNSVVPCAVCTCVMAASRGPFPPSGYASACSVHMTRPQCRALALARLVDLPKADNAHTHNITSFLPPSLHPLWPLFSVPFPWHKVHQLRCVALSSACLLPFPPTHPAACRVSIAALIKINIFCTKPNRDQEQVPALRT